MRTILRIIFWGFATIGVAATAAVIAAVVFTVNVRDRAPELPEVAILELDFNRAIPEIRREEPVLGTAPPPTVLELIQTLERAADDPRIKGVVAMIGEEPHGMARARELANAVVQFRESGKFAIAYADDLEALGDSGIEYMLAAAFEEVWLRPTGGLGLTGFVFEVPYFKGALDELSIESEFEQRHEFKGGADPFEKETMPLPVRRSLKRVADGWAEQLAEWIAERRGIDVAKVKHLIETGPFLAHDALVAGLVDRLGYYDQMIESLDTRAGLADWDFVSASTFLAAHTISDVPAAKIAVIQGQGPITGGGDAFADEDFGAYEVADALAEAAEDSTIDAILFRVDSPGGAYGPSDEVWRAVNRVVEADKPIVVSMGDMAASGGYFVSAAADHIIAQPGTLTGSIGVYAGKFATRGLWNRLGISWSRVSSGGNAGMYGMIDRFSPAQRKKFREGLDFVYEDFTGKVSAGRGLSGDDLDDAARGRLWTGADAVKNGLADGLGGYREAFAAIRQLLRLDPDVPLDLVILPRPVDAWERIQEWLEDGGDVGDLIQAAAGPLIGTAIRHQTEAAVGPLPPTLIPAGKLAVPPFRHMR